MKPSFKTIRFLALATIPFIITSCSSKEDDLKKSNTALLTQHPWEFSDVTSLATEPDVLEALADYKVFLKGLELTFKENKTYTASSTTFPILNLEGTWEFASSETKLTVKDEDGEHTFDIIRLDESTLEFKQRDESMNVDLNHIYKKK